MVAQILKEYRKQDCSVAEQKEKKEEGESPTKNEPFKLRSRSPSIPAGKSKFVLSREGGQVIRV